MRALLWALLALSMNTWAGIERECYQNLFTYGSSPDHYETSCDSSHMTTFRINGVCVVGQEAMCNNPDIAAIRLTLDETFAHWFWSGQGVLVNFDIAYAENQKSNGGVRVSSGKSYLAITGPNSHTLGVTEAWWTELSANNWESKHDLVALEYATIVLKEKMGRDKYRSMVLMPDGSPNQLGKAYFHALSLIYASIPNNSGNLSAGTKGRLRVSDFVYRDLDGFISTDDFDTALAGGQYVKAAQKFTGLLWSLYTDAGLAPGVFENFFFSSIDAIQVAQGDPAWFDIDDVSKSLDDGAQAAFVERKKVDGRWIVHEMPGKLPSEAGGSIPNMTTPILQTTVIENCAYAVRDGGGGNPGWGTLYQMAWNAVANADTYYYCGRLTTTSNWAGCYPTKGTVSYYPWHANEDSSLAVYACNNTGCRKSSNKIVWNNCPN